VRRALAIVIVVGAARAAHAFPTGLQFDADAVAQDGGGGIPFTGAPRWTKHTCSVCHTDPPGQISIQLQADDASLFSDGWKANQQYHMRVVLVGEHAGLQYKQNGDNCGTQTMPYAACDNNGFALEMDDASGMAIGSFVAIANGACANPPATAPLDADVRVLKDNSAVTHNGAHKALVQWDFCWTAPKTGSGLITAYVAVVDGNGGDGTASWPEDTLGDDVAAGAVPLPESGAAPPPPQSGGCSASDSLGGGAIVVVAIALALRTRRRRRSALELALAASVALAGCTHVRAAQRETLAKKNMKFSPDPVEDQLDLHMQEAREGSSGGYGSSGGGCGCN
jgi:hypothetical protein